MKYGHIELVGDIRDSLGANGLSHADLKNAVDNYHVQNTDTQLDSGVVEVDESDNVLILQNSINPFQSIASGAVDNTLVLKEGDVVIGADAPNARLDIRSYENNTVVEIDNDHTGHGLYIHQDGVLANNQRALYVYSAVAQTNSPLAYFSQNNASSTEPAIEIRNLGTGEGIELNNWGTGHGVRINAHGVLANSFYGLYVYSGSIQTNGNAYLFQVKQDNASSTAPCARIVNDGTGDNLLMYQAGVLASGKHVLYVYSAVAQTNSAIVRIYNDHASSDKPSLSVREDGSGPCIQLEAIGGATHINFQADPANNSPVDGDFWFDGADLKLRVGSTTYTLDKTAV